MVNRPARFLFSGIFLIACMTADAQEFRKFRVGFGVSYLPSDKGAAAASLEVSYRLKDNILIGFRGENAMLPNSSVHSQSLNLQYYFTGNKNFRPFVGVGAGMFRPSMMSGGCGSPGTDHVLNTETKFGFYPRIGFDFHHFSMTLDWNIASSSKSMVGNGLSPTENGYDPPHAQYLSNNYVALKLGFFIGGGKRKARRTVATDY
jgi:OmpW family